MEWVEMYLLHFEHKDKSRPFSEPIRLSYRVDKLLSIEECMKRAEPKDERMELVSCWIEARFTPKSLREIVPKTE